MRTTLSLTLGFLVSTSAANEVIAGYNAFQAAEVMVQKAGQSWEWGTAAEALLELYNPELSVYSNNAFPGGKIPIAASNTMALQYARQFINTNSQVFVGNSAVGDPASLGVSALLLGQSDRKYIDASNRQADYLLNIAPRHSNGAISHRPDVAELWADNVAMSFPFLAYLAVQHNNVSLMAETVRQISLYRAVLKAGDLNWRHIIGPQSQDTGLWSSGNGWAALGMTRVLHTLQKWPGSSGALGSQAGQLKSWIKEILDGAMQSGTDSGLLRNYLNDGSWFGEISGTALLSAIAYRMAVNDPGTFGQNYIAWADNNRRSLASKERGNGVFSPAVNPYSWKDRNQYTAGSPEGQAFMVFLYTAYRDCIHANICHAAPSKYPTCTAGSKRGCQCKATDNTCGPHQSCDKNGCAGSFNGLGNVQFAQCTGNFVGCKCLPTQNTCGPHQSCDKNGCAGSFNGLGNVPYAQCTGNFKGCECMATDNTCGPRQSCDKNGCAGSFNGLGNVQFPQCAGNFKSCECTATANTCGPHLSCDLHGCAGSFNGLGNVQFPQCAGNFKGCNCLPQPHTCGPAQDCGKNGCDGEFNLDDGKAYCTGNFKGCQCKANPGTCGDAQSCNKGHCDGKFSGLSVSPVCTNFFDGCVCEPTDTTCGPSQSCDRNGCAGGYDSHGVARCQDNFKGCKCNATPNTCGEAQDCDKNGCNGSFDANSNTARCRGHFKNCVCNPVSSTCGPVQSCSANGCNGAFNGGNPICTNNFFGCRCRPDPIWIRPPPHTLPPTKHTSFALLALERQTHQPHEYFPDPWDIFNINGVFDDDSLCRFPNLVTGGGKIPFPESMPAFNIEHFTNCRYSGPSDRVGTMSCDGATSVSCVEARGSSNCNNVGGTRYPDTVLQWAVHCTISGPGSV